jgi:hypothetical protein
VGQKRLRCGAARQWHCCAEIAGLKEQGFCHMVLRHRYCCEHLAASIEPRAWLGLTGHCHQADLSGTYRRSSIEETLRVMERYSCQPNFKTRGHQWETVNRSRSGANAMDDELLTSDAADV